MYTEEKPAGTPFFIMRNKCKADLWRFLHKPTIHCKMKYFVAGQNNTQDPIRRFNSYLCHKWTLHYTAHVKMRLLYRGFAVGVS